MDILRETVPLSDGTEMTLGEYLSEAGTASLGPDKRIANYGTATGTGGTPVSKEPDNVLEVKQDGLYVSANVAKGPKGDPGIPATITVGTVTQGTTADVKNVGTVNDAIFNFTLPKGDKGDKGDIGPKGDPADTVISQKPGNILQNITQEAANNGLYVPEQANTDLGNITADAETVIKNIVGNEFMSKADYVSPNNPDAVKKADELSDINKQDIQDAVDNNHRHDNKAALDVIIDNGDPNSFLSADGTYKKAFVNPDPDPTNALKLRPDGLYVEDLKEQVEKNKEDLEDIKLFKYPNLTLVGNPTVNQGQISFTNDDYARFPFVLDLTGKTWTFETDILSGNQTINQENILDSDKSIAIALRDNHFVLAVSNDGINYNEAQGQALIMPNTQVKVQVEYNGNEYKLRYSTDGIIYTDDITITNNQSIAPRQVFMGRTATNPTNHFTGTINLNNTWLKVNGNEVWRGMDTAGIASRAAIDLSNIDSEGEKKIRDVAGVDGKLNTGLDNISGQGQTAIKDIASAYFMETKDYVSLNTPNAVKKADELSDIANNDIQDTIDKKHEHDNKALLDTLVNDGDGTKYLADDGTYKEIDPDAIIDVAQLPDVDINDNKVYRENDKLYHHRNNQWIEIGSGGMPELSDDGGLEITVDDKLKMKSPIEVRETTQTITDYIPKATTEQYGLVKLGANVELTEEHKTGEMLNGKPVYEIFKYFPNGLNTGSVVYSMPDIDVPIEVTLSNKYNATTWYFNYNDNGQYTSRITLRGTDFIYDSDQYFRNKTLIVKMKYIKTTD